MARGRRHAGVFTAAGVKARWRLLRFRASGERMSPVRVAAGWAWGMFVGCTVPFGLQLLVSIPVAAAAKISKIGAAAATFVTNPVTIVFIYPAQCWVGSRLIGAPLGWEYLSGEVLERLRRASFFSREGLDAIMELGGRVVGGFLAGGLLLAAMLVPPTYFAVLRAARARQAARMEREARQQGARQLQRTEVEL